MPVYQVVTRTEQTSAPPRKRVRRISREWTIVYRFVRNISISALLFVLVLRISGSNYAFILLPVFLSLFITAARGYSLGGRSQSYSLALLVNSTPLYLLLTFCLSFVVYSLITLFVLLSHPASVSIIYVTVALAWAVILEPVREYFQAHIERRFNARNREAMRAVEAFTATLREEINLDQLREHSFAVIQQILRPYSLAFWTLLKGEQSEQGSSQSLAEITIESDDPFLTYALTHPGLVEMERLQLASPVVKHLKVQAIELVLLLVSQGELIGLLALGLRVDGEEYTSEERRLLKTLAGQISPALFVAQTVQEQQEQVREHERIEQELRTAQAIQQAFLPRDVPALPQWHLRPYYRPAREVGGDFYDFFLFEDGRLGLVIGDVTGKGIPAALVMATVHTMLRSTVRETISPGEVLARVNGLLAADIPAGMFVTCFYAILDPASGHVRYANAGHEPPYRHRQGNAAELWATGMPLGLMPDTRYEEYEDTLAPGETLLFYSDGLVEAHAPKGEMFGFPRLQALIAGYTDTSSLIDFLLEKLGHFTGAEWEQEDDVTMLTVQRMGAPEPRPANEQPEPRAALELLQETTIASVPGNEQQAMEWMAEGAQSLHLPPDRLDNLKTAVAEAVMNAIEHGNREAPDREVALQLLASDTSVVVRVRDQGDGETHPIASPETPDIEAKLAEEQSPRGWGLFLIKNLVDELRITNGKQFHLLELSVHREVVNNAE